MWHVKLMVVGVGGKIKTLVLLPKQGGGLHAEQQEARMKQTVSLTSSSVYFCIHSQRGRAILMYKASSAHYPSRVRVFVIACPRAALVTSRKEPRSGLGLGGH